jgi:putative membrane protein
MLPKYAVPVTVSLLLLTSLAHAVDRFPADNDFVRKAEQAGDQEVLAARTALTKSRNLDVRRIATAMQRDGTTVNRRLSTMAVEKGWPSPSLDATDGLGAYSDHLYVVSQIRAQQIAVAFYREEASTGADTDLRAFARKTLPTLRRRLLALQSLRSS